MYCILYGMLQTVRQERGGAVRGTARVLDRCIGAAVELYMSRR